MDEGAQQKQFKQHVTALPMLQQAYHTTRPAQDNS